MPKVKSMDVTIAGVTKSYDFGGGAETCSDEEGPASLELLRDAETTEVVMGGGITSARVTVEFTYTVTGSVEVDLDDLDGVEDTDDIIGQVEGGEFEDVAEAIDTEVSENVTSDYVTIDSVTVDEAFDEDGESVDF